MLSWAIDREIPLPRACDRCHALKERCEWMPDGMQCDRCFRLQHICETIRPKGRPGRKPGVRRQRLSSELRSHQNRRLDDRRFVYTWVERHIRNDGHIMTVPRSIPDLGGVPSGHQQMVQRLLFQGDLLDRFSIGTSFGEKIREQVIPHLILSKTTFQDGLLACAISWVGDVDGQANPSRLSMCYRYASSALATLATLQVTNLQTMSDCLMLGALVATFAVRLRLNDIQAITGRTLGLIEPFYAVSDPDRPEILVFMSCIVMWELRGCLLSCAVPTLRFRPPVEAYADRHVGLGATLLPLFHDICKISHELAHGNPDILEELDAVERSVRQWQPPVPEDFATRFSPVEVVHMLCQAQVMQLAALLATHRLRYPFGVNNEPAQVLSTTILTQLEMTFAATKEPVRCIDLALMLACLELDEAGRKKWFLDIATFAGFSPQFGEHVQDTLVSFWARIDLHETISWSDLTASGSPFLRNPPQC